MDAESAEDVLEALKGEDSEDLPNFIISDYRLSNHKTGLDVIGLARRALGGDIPAVIWSAETSRAKLQDIAAAGLEMLPKPLDEKLLIALLNKHRPS